MLGNEEWMSSDYRSVIISNGILKEVEKKLKQNPYDVDTWNVILRKAQAENVENVRILYEMLIFQFPSYGRYWKWYIKHEIDSRNYERAGMLFKRCFVRVVNTELLKMYVSYVKRMNLYSPLFVEKVAAAYKFAVGKVGMDILAYPIWKDYISFLKNKDIANFHFDANYDVEVICIEGLAYPMDHIMDLWEDYCSIETKDLIDLASNMYWAALRAVRDYKRIMDGLNRNALPLPLQNSHEDGIQVARWQEYIDWEKSDPIGIKNTRFYNKRVLFAYKQCLSCLWYHPNVWIEMILFLEQALSKKFPQLPLETSRVRIIELYEEATETYETAITLSQKNNMLLHFVYADFEEERGNYEKVHEIYNKLINNKNIDPTLTYIHYMKFIHRSADNLPSTFLEDAQKDPMSKYYIRIASEWVAYCKGTFGDALNIFEDGLKRARFGDDEECNLASYISFMTGDNFDYIKQILISGHASFRRSYKFREEFLKFESNLNEEIDMYSFLVEINEYEGSKSAFLVDYYSFLNLVPCTVAELKCIGYPENLE